MKKLSILALLLAFLFVGKSFAQPQVTVHVTGGYNLPMGQLKGDATVAADSNTYFQKNGFNAGADVKYFLGKKRNVGLTFSGAYNSFSSGDVTIITGYTSKLKINVISLGLGLEYAFMPKGKANPFVGVEFTGNFFSGNSKITTPTTTDSSLGSLKSASRFGIAGNLGVDVMLNKNIGFVIGAKYNMANLIGKEFDSTVTAGSTEFPLNDKENGTVSSKNISWLGVYAGVSFYFNRPKTTVRK